MRLKLANGRCLLSLLKMSACKKVKVRGSVQANTSQSLCEMAGKWRMAAAASINFSVARVSRLHHFLTRRLDSIRADNAWKWCSSRKSNSTSQIRKCPFFSSSFVCLPFFSFFVFFCFYFAGDCCWLLFSQPQSSPIVFQRPRSRFEDIGKLTDSLSFFFPFIFG